MDRNHDRAGAPSFRCAVTRGARNRCPNCGIGRVFAGYLKVVPECRACGTRLGELRADDALRPIKGATVGWLFILNVSQMAPPSDAAPATSPQASRSPDASPR